MNYYIQGDAARAGKIKAAFEKKGIDTSDWEFINHCDLYFNVNSEIYTIDYSIKHIITGRSDYTYLELPVEPKFKVGDEVIWTEPRGSEPAEPVKIIKLNDEEQLYMVDMGNGVGHISYDMQEYYKLAPKPHYDIANFHAGMPVLVRDYDNSRWSYVQFSHYIGEECGFKFNACGIPYIQCIPFNDDTKHLLGTTDMCPEEYVNW